MRVPHMVVAEEPVTLYGLVRDLFVASSVTCFLWAMHRIGNGLTLRAQLKALELRLTPEHPDIQRAKRLIAKLEQQAAANAQKVTDIIADLQKDIATFGMGDGQKKLLDLQSLGATPDQLAQAKAMLAQLDALNAQKKKQDEMAQAAQSIFDSTRSPLEKYEAQIGKLSELLNGGAIDWDTYGRAIRQARDELEKANAAPEAVTAPEIMQAGSAMAQRYTWDMTQGQQRMTKDEVQKKALATAQQSTRLLERIEKNTAKGGDLTVMDM